MVDACLKASSIRLIKSTIAEEANQVSKLGLDDVEMFSKIISRAIKNKLRRLPLEELKQMTLDSFDLFLEGQGSLGIGSTPTQAQANIIRSLTKVILHQISDSSNYELTEGQENLLISLCVEKLSVEEFLENSGLNTIYDNFANKVGQILRDEDEVIYSNEDIDAKKSTCFQVSFYCCLEDSCAADDSEIMEEFDKIDLQDGSGDGEEEETLVSIDPSVSKLPISRETLNQTKIQLLPSNTIEGMWESLYFEDNVKQKLFSYATISLKMSQMSTKSISSTLIANNKLLLVHGPPGTGKTTVCKALCQKLAIRQNESIDSLETNCHPTIIVEVSCSRIFSRWFGESSKNLDNIFKDVENLLIDSEQNKKFVCLLIDEVETIASSRSGLMNKNETTDGIRVVNTLLTQLDNLKKYDNLLILATSNLLDALDPAFVDRADGIFFIGRPSELGTVRILTSTIEELINTGIIKDIGNSSILKSDDYQQVIQSLASKCSVCYFVSLIFEKKVPY